MKNLQLKIQELKKRIVVLEHGKLEKDLDELEEFLNITKEDESLILELEKKIIALEKEIKKAELEKFFSGKYDKNSAIVQVFAGAGGRDAQDWATMLLRMYERYCQGKGFKVKILEQSFGEAGGPEGRIGTKSATMEIEEPFAFGLLKREAGVHRLVRISPFSPKRLRHTSFVRVEILPKIKRRESGIKISPEELRIETFRASGPGGQYVQKRETAVRIVHIPTGTTASCQSERVQGRNKEKAMEVLEARLHQLKEKDFQEEIRGIRGELKSASWGNQTRNYILHPYKLVKDLRTKVETHRTEEVLDGDLESFIEAEVRTINWEI